MEHFLTVEQIKKYVEDSDYGTFKYARVGNEIRYCLLDYQHSSLVKEGETAVSAGTFNIMTLRGDVSKGEELLKDSRIKIIAEYSMSLKVSSKDEDWQSIADAFGIKVVTRYNIEVALPR